MLRVQVAVVIVLVIIVIGWALWPHHAEGLTPIPGDPNRNILRRSDPYPADLYPGGMSNSLMNYYFQTDASTYSPWEDDYCRHAPVACKTMGLSV